MVGRGCNPCMVDYLQSWKSPGLLECLKEVGGGGGGIPVVHCNQFYYGVQLLSTAVDVKEYLLIQANMDTRYIVQ
jgi:hypothetical protein